MHAPRRRPPTGRPLGDGEQVESKGGPPPWALRLMRKRAARRSGTLVLALMGLALIVAVSGARVARQDVGYVGVVRNGGPLDARTIRQVLLPGARLTWIGLFSQAPHEYPSSNVNRTYTVTSDPSRTNRSGVDVLAVPTRDGVQVGIEATVFLRFVGESDIPTLLRFDVSYGTRRFRAFDGRSLYAWQGDDGFYAMLDAVFRPVLEYDIRKEIGRFQCAALVASCALVSRGAGSKVEAVPLADSDSIAERISTALEGDLTRTIGQSYFHDIRVRIARVTLPKGVQAAIDGAQAKFAAVSGAEAELKQAKYRAARNKLLGESYNASPALATVEAMKAIPKGSTVIVNTSGRPTSILAGAGIGGGGSTATTGATDSGG